VVELHNGSQRWSAAAMVADSETTQAWLSKCDALMCPISDVTRSLLLSMDSR
jgi:hypothetical protein